MKIKAILRSACLLQMHSIAEMRLKSGIEYGGVFMKQKIMTHALLLMSLTALTACPPSKSSDSNNANVAPQGRVMSQDSSSYCDLNNGTLTCYGTDQNTGRQCATLAKSYNPNDRVNLCSQLFQLRSDTNSNSGFGFVQCNVEGAVSSAISQHCQGVNDMWNQQSDPNNPNNPGNPGNPWNPGNPGNPNQPGATVPGYKSFQCDFEAQRTSGRRFTTNISIPRTTALIAFDGRTEQRIDLRTKFLGIDIGRFGTFSMKYKPARAGADESLELRNEGLRIGDERVRIIQTGSASQEVKMEALADGLYIKLSCRNSTQSGATGPGRSRDGGSQQPVPFSSPVSGTNLVCTGESNTVYTGREEIDLVLPLNSLTNGQDFQISEAVTGKLSGTSITYNAVLDRDFGPTVVSTSSLRSAAGIKTNDRVFHIDVTCSIR